MPAPLDTFIACQIVTLKKAGFSYQKIADELGLKTKSTGQRPNQFLGVTTKTKVFYQKNPLVFLQSYRKNPKKLVKDVLKDPKTTLERNRGKYNSFSTKESISRTTVRRILRKHGVFSRVAAKKISIKETSAAFRKKWSQKKIEKSAEYWCSVVFTNETRVNLTSDGMTELSVFCAKKHSLCAKKTSKM